MSDFLGKRNRDLSLPEILNLKIKGKDDAISACIKPLKSIISGEIVLAFNHARLLFNACKELNLPEEILNNLELLTKLSLIRNVEVINEVNKIMKSNNKKEKVLTDDVLEIYSNKGQIIIECIFNDIEFINYLLEENKLSDIESCSNEWNLNQIDEQQKMADKIVLIKKNNEYFVLLIVRGFGPGLNEYAFPGGMVEIDETFKECSQRECDEEVETNIFNLLIKNIEFEFEPHHNIDHEPRGKFPFGVITGGTVSLYSI